jgi:hypothetical protein
VNSDTTVSLLLGVGPNAARSCGRRSSPNKALCRKQVGFHAFRRFRLTWLRKNSVPKDLERYWMGHAPEEVGDLYSKLKDDVAFRQEWAERAGLGFELVHVGPQNAVAVRAKRVA